MTHWPIRELKQQTKELSIYQCVSVGVQEEGRPLTALFSVTVVSVSLSSMAGEPHLTRYTEYCTMCCTVEITSDNVLSVLSYPPVIHCYKSILCKRESCFYIFYSHCVGVDWLRCKRGSTEVSREKHAVFASSKLVVSSTIICSTICNILFSFTHSTFVVASSLASKNWGNSITSLMNDEGNQTDFMSNVLSFTSSPSQVKSSPRFRQNFRNHMGKGINSDV